MRSTEDRVLLLEAWKEQTEKRLGEGNRTFEDLRNQVQTRSVVRWAQVIGVVSVVAAVAYAAGKYPDRKEFDNAVGRVHERLDGVETDVSKLRLDQRDIKNATEATKESVESLSASIDKKLDAAIGRRKGR